ncbi:hypothetical protein COY91_02980 [Candidatus Shapirobacteria bacterium CG_4_10_14_0_8_um_filter_39_15]|nr:MAG: hypothetical protein COY91_02980 [Candidatus Shapirobacteria bacterium CG_4_10_14_0_8_um_filter_39_15]
MEEIPKIEIQDTDTQEQPVGLVSKEAGKKKILFRILPIILVVVIGIGVLVGLPLLNVVNKAKVVYAQGMVLKDSVKTKDLQKISQEIKTTRADLDSLKQALNLLTPLRIIPFVGVYQSDATHMVNAGEAGFDAAELVVKAVEPYSDLLGLFGGQVGGGEKTAKDRINFIVTTLDKIGPDIDNIGAKLEIVKKELDDVDPNRYPVQFKNYKVREMLTQAISLVDQGATLTNDAKPVIKVAPWLLGIDSPRQYLILFQNDAELRPTGGFITAYALLSVDKGKITPVLSEDIYDLDARFPSKEKAPQAFIDYLSLPYAKDSHWRLRDMNSSPDFKVSMEKFVENFKRASSQKFDGVVAVDTQLLVRLLSVIGRIGVPGWGNFSADPEPKCFDCPNVVYQLELSADKPVNTLKTQRKAVIGPLMHSVLANALGSPKEKIPNLFEAGFSSIIEKHVLFYFPDQKIQSAMEAFNLAGRVKDYSHDYFLLVDTSFSGAKSNIFIKNEVEQKIEIGSDGTITKTVTVTYKDPAPQSNCNLETGGLCLNSQYKDWFRLYVPQGSTLISSSGSEVDIKTYDELGKTVFDGYTTALRPEGITKTSFKYKLPFKAGKNNYQILIQKQPGTEGNQYTISLNKHNETFELVTDKELNIKI